MNLSYEKRLLKRGYDLVIGIDEAGRGPLAGPVIAGAVTFISIPEVKSKTKRFKFLLKNVNDSKKLSLKQRERIYEELISSPFFLWAEGRVGPEMIDKINILRATELAMMRATENLEKKIKKFEKIFLKVVRAKNSLKKYKELKPVSLKENCFLILDGNRGIDLDISQNAVIKGDQKVFLVAAASIIAKVRRDRLMKRYAEKYPQYGFEHHMGYPTKLHRRRIKKHGSCKIHRQSFTLL